MRTRINTSLFRSWHALVPALGVTALLVRSSAVAMDAHMYLVASGWITLALGGAVAAYVLRKYMHRLGYSPEFRLRVSEGALERAERRLNDIRRRIRQRQLTELREVRALAAAALKAEGVQRINRVEVQAGPVGGPAFALLVLPREPLGRVARWLHVHLYWGLAFGLFVLAHGGLELDAPLAWALNGLAGFVVLTGLIGIALWAVRPWTLTSAESDISIEKAHALDENLEFKIAEARDGLPPDLLTFVRDVQQASQEGDPRAAVSAAKRSLATRTPQEREAFDDLCALIGQRQRVHAELTRLRRIRFGFMAWRLIHVPAALLLAAAVAVHVVSVWWY